uniref:Uncharacterized protein n=1 Tax=uncultured miscellaneous Crenarchaeota group TaxID=1368239 RepID=W8RM02_9ARCH|nr:hypothetical protein Tery_2651 [uncultured miscellaneous Crenarchaeota group]
MSRDTGFWFRWIIANAVGELLGLGPVAFVAILLVRVFSEGGGPEALFGLGLFTLLGAYEGAVVGLAQWLVLRRRLPEVSRRSWIWATVAGAATAWLLGMLPSTIMSFIGGGGGAMPEPEGAGVYVMAAGMGLLLGAILAAPQWRVLRRQVHGAGWWIPANSAAWAAAMPLTFLAAGLPLPQDGLLSLLLLASAVIAAVGALAGAIHGAVLVRLTR